jgi:hypothetical protein
MVRMLQIANPLRAANPNAWEKLLHNVGVTASAAPPPADLDRIMERVFRQVREAGIKDPALWMEKDMARVEAALASVEPEAPLKVALPVAVHPNPAELEPMKLGTDPAKTSGASPLALETGIKDSAARIATDTARVEAASASVEPEAPRKVARPVAVRQNPVEPKPVKVRTDRAKMFDLSLLELETASEIAAQELNSAKLSIEAGKRREAANYMYNAHDLYYATQQEIAAALGKSQGWVSCMIRWRREGFKDDTPFGPASKDARFAARIGRGMAQKPPRGLVRRWMRGPHRPEDDAHARVSSGVLVIPVADIKRSENT